MRPSGGDAQLFCWLPLFRSKSLQAVCSDLGGRPEPPKRTPSYLPFQSRRGHKQWRLLAPLAPEGSRSSSRAPSASKLSQFGLFLLVVRSCSFTAQVSHRNNSYLYACMCDFAHGRDRVQRPPVSLPSRTPSSTISLLKFCVHPFS